MPFNYDKNKQDDQGHFWASYSDLLLGLSVVFLLLYVTASVRSGAAGMQTQAKNQKLNKEIQDLRNQLKVYNNMKDDYIQSNASKDEQQEYVELLDKLSLLEDEAKSEKESLKQAMYQQSQKEKALNQYQQMVRNIINANAIAKKKVLERNEVILTQDQEIEKGKQQLSELSNEIKEKEKQIESNKLQLSGNIAKLKKLLKFNQLSEKAYASRLAQLKQKSEKEIAHLKNGVAQYKNQFELTKSNIKKLNKSLSDSESNLNASRSKIYGLEQEQKTAQQTIKMLQAEVDARKKVAKDIQQAFAKKGILADVNESGDVILDFGEHHFENNSAKLKKGMIELLEKAMPEYAKALLGNPKLADKVTSIEIIGFASPTFKGKFINPNSEVSKDQEALAYNMDLSYRRAKSIYEYSFLQSNKNFEYQKKMLPLVKVSARSYLELFDEKRRPSNFEQFCKSTDCTKARKVMIKFSMDNNK